MYRYPSVLVSSRTRTRSPLRNTCSGSTRTAKPFESRMNNVTPRPRRRALTGAGVDEEGDGLGLGLGVLSVLPEVPEPPLLPEPLLPELVPVEPPPDGVVFLRLLVL